MKNEKNNRYSKQTLGTFIGKLKDNISIVDVLEKVGWMEELGLKKTGDSLQGDCPHHDSEAHKCFSIKLSEGFFHCFSCGFAGDIVTLVMRAKECNAFQASKWLAQTFTPDLTAELEEMNENLSPEKREYLERAMFYEAVYEEGKKLMDDPKAESVIKYLVDDRKYDKNLICKTEFIYWDDEYKIRQNLKRRFPNLIVKIDQLPLNGFCGDYFRLALPFRDRFGVITGFVKRSLKPEGQRIHGVDGVRYDSTKEISKPDFFGLNKIPKDQDTIVLVEGYPDAAYLPVLGLKNIVALGQGSFSEAYHDGIKAKGIKRIVIALDNDPFRKDSNYAIKRLEEASSPEHRELLEKQIEKLPSGLRNTQTICNEFVGTDTEIFVIEPKHYGTQKDPDEFVRVHGIKAFNELVRKAESASKWMGKHILSKYDLSNDIEKSRAIEEILSYEDRLTNPLDSKELLDSATAALNISPDFFNEYVKSFREKRASERYQENVSSMIFDIEKLLHNGKVPTAMRMLNNKPKEFALEFERRKADPVLPLDHFIQEKKKQDEVRNPGELLGYDLHRFPILSKKVCGIQSGFYILAADANLGKTALMVNIMLDILESNKKISVGFYSVDDGKETIINRVLAVLSGLEINQVQTKQADAADQRKLDTAYEYLLDLVKADRLSIADASEIVGLDDIEVDIRRRKTEEYAVFIDGVYNTTVGGDSGSIREENIQRATQLKLLSKSMDIPVIVTGEVRKKTGQDKMDGDRTIHDLMESGKYGYNADVVWILKPLSSKNYGRSPDPIIQLKFEKNKLASCRDEVSLKFTRAKSHFEETGSLDDFGVNLFNLDDEPEED